MRAVEDAEPVDAGLVADGVQLAVVADVLKGEAGGGFIKCIFLHVHGMPISPGSCRCGCCRRWPPRG